VGFLPRIFNFVIASKPNRGTLDIVNSLETAPPDCACGIISIWAFVNPPDFFLQNAVIFDRTQRQGQGAAVLEKYKQEV